MDAQVEAGTHPAALERAEADEVEGASEDSLEESSHEESSVEEPRNAQSKAAQLHISREQCEKEEHAQVFAQDFMVSPVASVEAGSSQRSQANSAGAEASFASRLAGSSVSSDGQERRTFYAWRHPSWRRAVHDTWYVTF